MAVHVENRDHTPNPQSSVSNPNFAITPDSLQSEPVRNPNHFRTIRIPIDAINVFTQPRQQFDGIEELALSIANNGIFNPQDIGMYTYEQALEHIKLINRIWGTNHTADELTGIFDGKYPVLLAGERRTRAERLLATKGCSECQAQYGESPCIERHFGDRGTDIRYKPNMTVKEGMRIQASENIHRRVPPAQEAKFYYRYLQILREEDPAYTITRFADDVSRSPEYVRNAIKYSNLPPTIQAFVEGSRNEGDEETSRAMKFGIALELARLQTELGIDEEGLLWWAAQSVGKRVEDFRQIVSNFINQEKSGQTLMHLLTDTQEEDARRSAFRRTVDPELRVLMHRSLNFMRDVNALIRAGVLSKGIESPYSPRSPRNVIMKIVDFLDGSLPELERILTAKELKRTEKVVGQARAVLTLLERTNDQEDDSGDERIVFALN